MIKIYIEGESPLATLADLVAVAHYYGESPAVSAAARNVIAADEKSIGPMARRDTNSMEVVNLGSRPRHHEPNPDTDSGQHIFITQREENPSDANSNASGAAPAPASGNAPGRNASANGANPNAAFTPQRGSAVGGYPGPAAAQNSPLNNGYPGNGGAQNPSAQGGYGYGGYPPANGAAQNPPPVGAQGAAQGNPTSGAAGTNATMTQTSLFNGQSVANPGAGPIPVSGAPAFTVEQVGRAGADLVTQNPAKRNELNALLQRYGVQSVSELRPEYLGQFAQELRGMGARI